MKDYVVATLWEKKAGVEPEHYLLMYRFQVANDAQAEAEATRRGRAELAGMGKHGFEPVMYNQIPLK